MPRKTIYISKETKELEKKIAQIVLDIMRAGGNNYVLDVYNQSALYRKGLLLLEAFYSKELVLVKTGLYDFEEDGK